MKLSSFITFLQDRLEEHGDCEVAFESPCNNDGSRPDLHEIFGDSPSSSHDRRKNRLTIELDV